MGDLFGPSDVPRTVALPDYRGLDLTSEEGYLLSRIDGRMSVSALQSVCGWEKEKTHKLLESLLRKHVVNFDRKEIMDAAFGPGEQPSRRDREREVSDKFKTVPEAASAKRPKVAIDPSTIERVPDLDEARCIEILQWERLVDDANDYYAVFDVPRGADVRTVKRAYREMALANHPDKFFRKDIGGYRERVQTTWKHVQEAYDALTDPERKKTYDEELLSRPASAPAPASPPPMPLVFSADTGSVRIPTDTFKLPTKPARPAEPMQPQKLMESALERKIRQDVEQRIGRAKRSFDQAQEDFKARRWAGADSNYKLAIQFDPKNPDYPKWWDGVKGQVEEGIITGLLQRAEMAVAGGDQKTQVDALEHAAKLFPDNVEVNLALGLVLVEQVHEYKRAKDCLQKVVTKRPKEIRALIGLGRAMRYLGMFKNALRVMEQAKELAPKDARVATEIKEIKRSL